MSPGVHVNVPSTTVIGWPHLGQNTHRRIVENAGPSRAHGLVPCTSMATTYQGKQFRFVANAELGGGGMARVYLGAREDDPDILVAIKTPRDDLPDADRELFLREADAAMKVADPHVVRVVDWGTDPKPFIAFEYVSGGSLDREISRRQGGDGPWSEADLLGIYRQLTTAMKAINKEVIHRDLKPPNVFYQDGQIKIGDFGIAKYVGQVTRSRSFKGWGTLPYMAPETIKSESLDWRSDQYSLGIVMYEMAALKVPFVGDQDQLVHQHLYVRPPRLNEVAKLSVKLGGVIARMLEKRVDQRFQSWDEVEKELRDIETVTPVGAGAAAEDPLAAAAVRQIEAARARTLERERTEEEKRTKHRDRQQLLAYWANEMFSVIRERLAKLNEAVREIHVTEASGTRGTNALSDHRAMEARFLHAQMKVGIEVVPVEGSEELLAWGTIEVTTNKRTWVGNLALTANPPPYGAWVLVEMEVSPMIPAEPSDKEGGRYSVVGGQLVVARNWIALVRQRRMKGVMSSVVYKERALPLTAVLDDCLMVFIEDAAVEPEPTGGRRR